MSKPYFAFLALLVTIDISAIAQTRDLRDGEDPLKRIACSGLLEGRQAREELPDDVARVLGDIRRSPISPRQMARINVFAEAYESGGFVKIVETSGDVVIGVVETIELNSGGFQSVHGGLTGPAYGKFHIVRIGGVNEVYSSNYGITVTPFNKTNAFNEVRSFALNRNMANHGVLRNLSRTYLLGQNAMIRVRSAGVETVVGPVPVALMRLHGEEIMVTLDVGDEQRAKYWEYPLKDIISAFPSSE